MSTMKVVFNERVSEYAAGKRYEPGKVYYVSKDEACVWIKRDAVDIGSLEPAYLTPEAIAEHEANLLESGPPLTHREWLDAKTE